MILKRGRGGVKNISVTRNLHPWLAGDTKYVRLKNINFKYE